MLQKLFGIFLILLLILFGWAFYNAAQKMKKGGSESPSPTVTMVVASPSVFRSPSPNQSPDATPAQTPEASKTPQVRIRSVSIDVDNSGAGETTVPVIPGMLVRLTLNVMPVNVDPQGLRFTSPVISSGIIVPGASKTMEFTAAQAFTITGYAVSTGAQLPYTINVVLQ